MQGPLVSRLTLVATLVVCAAVWLAGASARPAPRLTATASGSLQLDNSRDGRAILSASRMRPGDAVAGTLALSNRADHEQRLTLSTPTLNDLPGSRGGVLSRRLDLEVERVDDGTVVYDGKLHDLEDVELGALASRATSDYRMTVSLPEGGPAVDDAYAGSRVDVAWRWRADTDAAPKTPAPAPGVTTARPPVTAAPRGDSAVAPVGVTADGGPAPEARPVRLWLGGTRSQRMTVGTRTRTAFSVLARCRPGCALSASATVVAGRTRIVLRRRGVGRARSGALAPVPFTLTAAEMRRLRRTIGHRAARVTVAVTAVADGYGTGSSTRHITLRARSLSN